MRTRRRFRAVLLAVAAVPLGLAPVPATAADTTTWSLRPESGGDLSFSSTTTPRPLGIRTFPVRRLDRAVDTIDASFTHGPGTSLDVRGLRADGTWSEWIPIPADGHARLPEATDSVQTRLVHTGPARVSEVRLTGTRSDRAAGAAARPAHPRTFRIFATREGLVGHTTANGHVITKRDHFVALPSRRGLATRGTGDYTVRVCTTGNARCEWAPVWDVGPWNTRDDHWNSSRQSWPDLPHGKPQAQAAYQNGHNGGLDQFGRRVANPAGIDLADGTFWDGLRLKTNAWVTVTYQWTGRGPWGTVVTPRGIHLNVRAGTSASTRQLGLAARHARVRIVCSVTGDRVHGSQGTSNVWYRLLPGKHVAAAYIDTAVAPRRC